MNPLLEQITSELPWLFEDVGFTVVSYSYDAKHMGDCIVILSSNALRLRFVTDRGQVMLDLASPSHPSQWIGNWLVLEAIGRGSEPKFDFASVGSRLEENYPRFVEALGPNYSATVRAVEQIKRDRMLFLRVQSERRSL